MQHVCEWFPNGTIRCNLPASKCVELITKDFNGKPERYWMWLCDQHYQDSTITGFWEGMNVTAIF